MVAGIAVEHKIKQLVISSAGAGVRGRPDVVILTAKKIENDIRGHNIHFAMIRTAEYLELLLLPGMGLDQNKFTFFNRPEQSF